MDVGHREVPGILGSQASHEVNQGHRIRAA